MFYSIANPMAPWGLCLGAAPAPIIKGKCISAIPLSKGAACPWAEYRDILIGTRRLEALTDGYVSQRGHLLKEPDKAGTPEIVSRRVYVLPGFAAAAALISLWSPGQGSWVYLGIPLVMAWLGRRGEPRAC